MRILKTGDMCPICGQPILTEDSQKLRLLAAIADLLGLPDPEKEDCADGDKIQGPEGSAAE